MKRLAWGLWLLFVLLCGATVAIIASAGGDDDEGLSILLIGYVTVGAMIASRDARNLVGWLLLAVGIAWSVSSLGEAYALLADAPGRGIVGLVAQSCWYIWFILIGIAVPLLFPNGRLLSPRWRPVVWITASALVLSIVGTGLKPGRLDLSVPVANPLAASGGLVQVAKVLEVTGNLLAAVAFALGAASLVLRIRRSRGVERAQIKWFALVALLATTLLGLAMLDLLFEGRWSTVVGSVGWNGFLLLAIVGIPAATGIAVMRHGLYDIDVVIRRTLVYAALTATLAAGYLLSVLMAQQIVGAESSFAIALSTLAMAALFRPALARIQALVDRRFFRRRYDARQTLEQFGSHLRDELDLEALGADLRGVVRETMQPASVSLWLRSRE